MSTSANFEFPIQSIALYRDEEFRVLVNSVKDYAIFMIDPEGIIKTWNDGAKYIYGYEAYEIIGKHISVFFTKKDIENGLVAENMQMAKELGSLENKGWRLRKNGSVFWAEVIFTACYNEQHRMTGYAKVVKKISDQKIIRDDLPQFASKRAYLFQSAYEKLLFHIENTPLGLIEWDNKLHIRSLSKRAEEILGWNLQEFIENENSGFSQVYEGDQPWVFNVAGQLLSGNIERNNIQHRNYRKDGSVIWCDWFNSVLKDKNGKIITIMSLVQDITERKSAEEALKSSEADLQAIFENTSHGFILTDTKGIVKSFNSKSLDTISLNIEKVIKVGDSIFDFIHPSGRDAYKNAVAKVLTGETFQYERLCQRKNGEKKWYNSAINPVYGAGKTEGLCITYSDITERKIAEELLLKSQSNLTAVIENADAMIYSLDPDFRYITFNQRLHDSMKQMYGLDIKPGDHFYDFFEKLNPKEARDWEDVHSKALGGEIAKFEREFNHDNSPTHFDFSIHPIWKNKNVIGLSCFALDITKQKQAEVIQRQNELRYRQIVETAQEGIWLVDENSKTSFVNQKLCDILEYSEEEMLGKDFFYFIDDADKQRAKSMKRRKGGVAKNIDFRFITKSGRYIWTNITANRIFDNEGNYKSTLVMVSDITEKKILQQQLLEGQINKQREITKAVVRALEKERAEIGQELHDNINQLLIASKFYLTRSLVEPGYVPLVLKSKEYITTTIEEIRKLSHALIGPDQDKTLGLIDSIEELISNISLVKDIKISFNYSSYCEEESEMGLNLVVYRIIQEQINNIFKHAEAGEVDIELKREENDLILIINDNGKGFDTSAKRKGVGLINIKSRAALYDGKVQILSSPGNGCKMKVVFKHHW